MSYGRCVACTEEGVKRPFGKVCIYCGTNQKQFSEQERQERQEAFEDAAELAGQFKWLSIPVGLIAGVLAGVLSFNAGWGAWSALAAVFIGGLGYVYSIHILALGAFVLVLAMFA